MESGTRLGPYKILEQLGAGGMGEVYRALDTELQREVALKILPDALTEDAQLLARLQREAQMLAAVSHVNIAAIHRVGEARCDRGVLRYIDMELVDGKDLTHSLRQGVTDSKRALELGSQIAGALSAAHGRGIIHRDLKPANVMVTSSGQAKLLDFGLAREVAPVAGADGSPTGESILELTDSGVVIGTVPYMSPEQARGQSLDQRSDVWAFGCLLFELLCGMRAFERDTPAETLAAILEQEPDWKILPPDTPPVTLALLRRCLQKDREQRMRDLGDARLELEESLVLLAKGQADPSPDSTPAESRRGPARLQWTTIAIIGAIGLAAGSLMTWSLAPAPNGAAPAEANDNPLADASFSLVTDFEGSQFDAAISPDGRLVAFSSVRDGKLEILVGPLGKFDFTDVAPSLDEFALKDALLPIRSVGFNDDGLEVWLGGGPWRRLTSMSFMGGPLRNFLGPDVVNVAWSPDGRRLAYHERTEGDPVYVADVSGANAHKILGPPAGTHQHFPTWSPNGEWIYVSRGFPLTLEMDLWRVRPDGEGAEQLTFGKLDVRYPTSLDDRTVLYCARDSDGAGPWIWAVDVETKTSRRATVGLQQYSSVAASRDGLRLVATVQDPRAALWTVPILDGLAMEEDAAPFEDLGTTRALAPRFGGESLFYLSSRGSSDGLWCFEDGVSAEVWRGSEIALLEPAAVSPDGTAVALLLRRAEGWHLDVLSPDSAVRKELSREIDVRGAASWSPDGRWIVTGGNQGGVPGLFKIPVDGGPPVRLAEGIALDPVWSPKGDLIMYAGRPVSVLSPLLAVRPDGTPVDVPRISLVQVQIGERLRFLPDGSGLVYMQGQGPTQDFWHLDIETWTSKRLTRLDSRGAMRTFDITPDGEHIVFDRLSVDSDIVLIERPVPASPEDR